MIIKNLLHHNSVQRIITGLLLAAGLCTLFFYCPPILLAIVIVLAMCIMLQELHTMLGSTHKFFTLALFYPIIPCIFLIYFNQSPAYHLLLIYLFVLVFSFDTGSYVAGKLCSTLWTTHKIVPAISPGKSWEGACGGYLTTTVLFLTLTKNINFVACALSLVICIIAFVGDIFESWLKRSAGIKDSGTILPGHGGLLDRFDAILFVTYFFFVFKNYLVIVFA